MPATIPVAEPVDLTGDLATYGEQFSQGFATGVAAVNSSRMLGSSKLAVTKKDTASTPATAASVVSQIAHSPAVAVVGLDTSGLALAAAPIAQQASLPTLVDCAPIGMASLGDEIYSVQTSQITIGKPIAAQVAKSAKTASILYANDNPDLTAFSKVLVPALKADGVKVQQVLGTSIATTDYSPFITRLLSGSPDAIVVGTAGPGALSLIQGLRSAGYKGKIFGHPGDSAVLQGAASYANGVVFPTEWLSSFTSAASKTFLTRVTAKYPKANVTNETVDGYDAAYLLAHAIKASGSATRAGILKGLQAVTRGGVAGPPGKLTFGSPGGRQVSAPTYFAKVENGKFVKAD